MARLTRIIVEIEMDKRMGLFDKFRKEDVVDPPDNSETSENTFKENDEKIEGKIISINPTKGYGFISSRDIPFTRIFFHWSALRADTVHFTKLEIGMKVEFRLVEVPGRGYRAVQVSVLDKDSFYSPEHD